MWTNMAVTGGAVTPKLLSKSGSLLSKGFVPPVTAACRPGECYRGYSKPRPRAKRSIDKKGEEFTKIDIRGFNVDQNHGGMLKPFEFRNYFKIPVAPPRCATMPTDQDWTSVWPAAQTFKHSAVPLPVRQGVVFGEHENKGLSPAKYANAELIKVPNFLHLTPKHIQQQCAAIKKYCTPWPKELTDVKTCFTNFPLEIQTSDYLFDGPSIREPEARRVTLKIEISHLGLDYHAKDKLRRLVGDRLDEKKGILTLVTDRCPSRKQNLDYAMYLLTVLNFECRKIEPWESEKTVADNETYIWDVMPSKQSMLATLEKAKQATADNPVTTAPEILNKLPDNLEDLSVDELDDLANYKKCVNDLHNEGETLERLEEYKRAVRKLLIG